MLPALWKTDLPRPLRAAPPPPSPSNFLLPLPSGARTARLPPSAGAQICPPPLSSEPAASRDFSIVSASRWFEQHQPLFFCNVRICGGNLDRLSLLFLLDLDAASASARLVSAFFCRSAFWMSSSLFLIADLALGVDPRVICLTVCHRLCNRDFLLRFRLCDRGLFLNLGNIVDTQIVDDSVGVRKILYVKAYNIQPHRSQIRLRIFFYQLGKFLRSPTISSSLMRPTISRMLPSRTSLATCVMYCVFWFKVLCRQL